MNDYRERLLKAAEEAYRQEQERQARFTAFLSAHAGMLPGAASDLATAILRTPVNELPDDQLRLLVIFTLGLPAEYSYSEEQLELALSHKRPDLMGARRGLSVH
jgi:hypothetical protein